MVGAYEVVIGSSVYGYKYILQCHVMFAIFTL
jgi:hypothetical protein